MSIPFPNYIPRLGITPFSQWIANVITRWQSLNPSELPSGDKVVLAFQSFQDNWCSFYLKERGERGEVVEIFRIIQDCWYLLNMNSIVYFWCVFFSHMLWKATNSHNKVLLQLGQKATMPGYLAQSMGTI